MIHFLRSNILKKISSKISSVATKKNVCSVDKKSVSSVCSVDYSECAPWIYSECPPWIIQSVAFSDDSGRLQLYSHLLLELLGLLASNLSEVATR